MDTIIAFFILACLAGLALKVCLHAVGLLCYCWSEAIQGVGQIFGFVGSIQLPKLPERAPEPPPPPPPEPTPEERYKAKLQKLARLPLDEDERMVITEETRKAFIKESMR